MNSTIEQKEAGGANVLPGVRVSRREYRPEWFAEWVRLAVKNRNAAREAGISARVREIRLDGMRFWARLAVRYRGRVA